MCSVYLGGNYSSPPESLQWIILVVICETIRLGPLCEYDNHFYSKYFTNCKNYETYNFYTKPVKFIVRKNRINYFDSIKQNNLLQHWKFNAF